MISRKPARVWTAFALCAALVLAAMAMLTRGVLDAGHQRARAEADRQAAEIRADIEERTRLALWRMDAAATAIILREKRASTEAAGSPPAPEVRLRFTARPGQPVESADSSAGSAALARFRELLAEAPSGQNEWETLRHAATDLRDGQEVARHESPPGRDAATSAQARIDKTRQIQSNVAERDQRFRAIGQTLDAYNVAPPQLPVPIATPMHPAWLGGEQLLLLREIQSPPAIQGVWIDWQQLADTLLDEIRDLLPDARLVPAAGAHPEADPLTLASFPLQLVRGESAAAPAPAAVTLDAPLRIAWAAVAFALIAAAILAAAILRLSERRASFVSAVTHELRTPLTTFRLYSDLLEKNAVHGEKRARYLRTLTREADRLTHLVENVLAFSRIENRGTRTIANPPPPAVANWLAGIRPRLEDRLATAGLTLHLEVPENAATLPLHTDTAALEHILFNLIDNAAKYAAASTPPQVHLEVARSQNGRALEIHVRDHGPGIPDKERRHIFRPFHKSDLQAANSRPGVGLGLALSHRLARSLGARLELRPSDQGAHFTLTLPTPP